MLQQLQSFMTHLIQSLPPCMHIRIVNSQDGGQLASLACFERKQLGFKPSPTTLPVCGTRSLPIYYLSVYVHTQDPFIWYTAEHNSHLTIHSFPFVPSLTLSHTSILNACMFLGA